MKNQDELLGSVYSVDITDDNAFNSVEEAVAHIESLLEDGYSLEEVYDYDYDGDVITIERVGEDCCDIEATYVIVKDDNNDLTEQ